MCADADTVCSLVSALNHVHVRLPAEEREERREGSDSHPVHELARSRRPRRATPPPEAEAAGQRLQELLQWADRCSLQARDIFS